MDVVIVQATAPNMAHIALWNSVLTKCYRQNLCKYNFNSGKQTNRLLFQALQVSWNVQQVAMLPFLVIGYVFLNRKCYSQSIESISLNNVWTWHFKAWTLDAFIAPPVLCLLIQIVIIIIIISLLLLFKVENESQFFF